MLKKAGFTLIEILIVIAIVAILATFVIVALSGTPKKARDARRKAEISEIGRVIALGCYVPATGEGNYDLAPIVDELKVKYSQYASYLVQTPYDPVKGNATESFYRYIVTSSPKKCAIYANLEYADELVTLPNLSAPTAGGGTGVLQTSEPGWNGTNKYFQFSN